MFSKSCEYALRACIFLSQKQQEPKKWSIPEIAAAIDSPQPFTAKILQTLAKQKIVSSTKGPNGGFYISTTNKPVKLATIILAIDGEDVFKRCGLGLGNCNHHKPCPIHDAYKPISDANKKLFETTYLHDLATSDSVKRTFLKR